MSYRPSLLVTQSFVVSLSGSYWDYRDYIFSLCSNLSIKDSSFRLNLERDVEFAGEILNAAKSVGFSDISVTIDQPESWANYMLKQLTLEPREWTMPWPGDHIYVHPDDNAYVTSLKKAEQLGADAVVYGHMQDFEHFLDWDRVVILHNDSNYIMIKWGNKHHYKRNSKINRAANKLIGQEMNMVPVPGFATYRSALLKKILEALPPKTKRWQDMEYSASPAAWEYKLLIPKQCLYRHVHGYWFEGLLKYRSAGVFPRDIKAEIESWYIASNYNWRCNSPTRHEYRNMCLKIFPYFEIYFRSRNEEIDKGLFGRTPFDANWIGKHKILRWFINVYMLLVYELPRRKLAQLKRA